MSTPQCELEGASVILVGDFNPRIFQPEWLGSHNLLRPEEVEAATEGEAPGFIIATEVSSFKAGWLELQVTKQRFTAQTADPAHYSPLRDLVLSTFRLLEHTPFNQMGINRLAHYSMPSGEEWNAFGDFLAPKKAWQGLMDKPGLLSLRIIGPKPGSEGISYTTRVEPSARVPNGVFIETNEHHKVEGSDSAKRLMTALEESWQPSLDHANKVADQLFGEFYSER